MSKARQLADLLDASGDVSVGALDNVPPNTALVDSSDNTVLDTSSGYVATNSVSSNSINYGASSSATFDNVLGSNTDHRVLSLVSGSSTPASMWWADASNTAIGAVDGYSGGGLSLWANTSENGWQRGITVRPNSEVDFDGNINVSGQTFTKKPYMQVQTTGSRTYPDGWSNVYFDVNKFNYNCSHNSNYYFEFYKTGMYRITVSYRYGSGGDVWTANRMYNVATARELGISHGTGQTANDPATNHFEYFIEVQDADLYANAGNNVVMQWLRVGSSFTIADPYSTLPALVVTVEYFSDL